MCVYYISVVFQYRNCLFCGGKAKARHIMLSTWILVLVFVQFVVFLENYRLNSIGCDLIHTCNRTLEAFGTHEVKYIPLNQWQNTYCLSSHLRCIDLSNCFWKGLKRKLIMNGEFKAVYNIMCCSVAENNTILWYQSCTVVIISGQISIHWYSSPIY